MTCKCGGKMAVNWQHTSLMPDGRMETPAVLKCKTCGEQAATVAEGYLLKADTPNANGDIFPADALREGAKVATKSELLTMGTIGEFSMGCSAMDGRAPWIDVEAKMRELYAKDDLNQATLEPVTMHCDACGAAGQGFRSNAGPGWRSFPPGWLVSDAPSDFLLVCSVACALGVNG